MRPSNAKLVRSLDILGIEARIYQSRMSNDEYWANRREAAEEMDNSIEEWRSLPENRKTALIKIVQKVLAYALSNPEGWIDNALRLDQDLDMITVELHIFNKLIDEELDATAKISQFELEEVGRKAKGLIEEFKDI